jgi:hypothetical protein
MKSFQEWLKDKIGEGLEDITGVYPVGYGGIGNYPPLYGGQSNPYLAYSRKIAKKRKKRKKKKS